MKTIALGDTHGRTDWKIITSKNDFDKVIFIGDYFDTHENVSPQQQKDNFRDIVAFKKANMNKVVLLFGNHDYHYLRTTNEQYSGFQQWQKTDIQELLHKAIDGNLLQMCHVENNFLFTHAGVTRTWCNANNIDLNHIQQSINDLFKYQPNAFRFTAGRRYNNYGDDITQTPIWVRPRSLYEDKIPNYIQVVGHTTQDKLEISLKGKQFFSELNQRMYETSGVIFIDTLGTSGEYLKIIDGVMAVGAVRQ